MSRPSRRSVALATVGFLHLGIGWQLILSPEVPADPGLALLHAYIPTEIRIGLWTGAGLLCMLLPWRPRTEKVGWAVAMAMPVERTVSYFWSGINAILPGWPPGAFRSFGTMAFWLGICFIIWLMSGWTETERVPK